MRRLSLLLAVVFVLPLLGSNSPKEYDDRTEVAGIEGTWRMVETSFGGKKHNYAPNNTCFLTYCRGKWTTSYHGKTERGEYKADISRTPARLDTVWFAGSKRIEGAKYIFEVDGVTLRETYFVDDDHSYPKTFTDDNTETRTYKRVPK